ncbi:MAG: CRISPR-associated helicase Cas3' [Rikenellaceae bacterium]
MNSANKTQELESIISHIRPPQNPTEDWVIQPNDQHCEQVALLAAKFAKEFGLQDFAHTAGLLHDKGKEQSAFQSYIKHVSGYDTSQGSSNKTPHAYVGALIAKKLYPTFYNLISPIIIGHHRGLYDWSEFLAKMECEIPQEINIEETTDQRLFIPDQFTKYTKDIHHIIRQLFSCLVDADYLDTEAFMSHKTNALRNSPTTITDLSPKLEAYLNKLKNNATSTPLNKLRNTIQQHCLDGANNPPGFYSLSVPTGGGKTLSSLVWAIHHCIKHNKRRIIIVIPYTSIITQTAQILRDIFGAENILEHHSSTTSEPQTINSNEALRERLATENWDYPIIVTTNVQLFESIYSHRSSQCRKLHNICNSVLILDEAQVLPLEHLQPILDSLKSYQRAFGISVLFTTASLPAFRASVLKASFDSSNSNQESPLDGFEHIHELIPQSLELHKLLQRTELYFDDHTSSYADIAERISSHQRVLCVVNTRKDAFEIYNRLPKDGCNIHLSRMMCSEHLAKTIAEIKKTLKESSTTPIRVISTQLIEAGVDIDFPIVYRSEAGLDSILQAAGRCNREGKIERLAPVYVFKLEHPLPRGFITHGANSTKSLDKSSNWYSPETMTNYFIQLYSRTSTFDKANIKDLLYTSRLCLETASTEFKLIEDNTITVIVNYGKSAELIQELKEKGINYNLRKELLQYSINLREYDFKKLARTNLLEEVLSGIYFLPDREQYRDDIGLQIESHFLEEILIK